MGVAVGGGEGTRQKLSLHTLPAPSMNQFPTSPVAVDTVTPSPLTPISL